MRSSSDRPGALTTARAGASSASARRSAASRREAGVTDEFHRDGLPTPRRYLAMLAIAIGIAMAVLDGTVVNVALPSIAGELGASPSASVWVINAYQLTIVVLLLPLASLGERLGYRRNLPGRGGGLHGRLARLRALREPGLARRRPRRAGGGRRRDHEHERRAGPAHLPGRAPRPRHRPERAGRRPVGRRRPVARLGHPRGRSLALALRDQRALRPDEPRDRPAPAGVGAVLPAVRLDERPAQRRDVRPVLRRLRRADPRRRRAARGRGAPRRRRWPAPSSSGAARGWRRR